MADQDEIAEKMWKRETGGVDEWMLFKGSARDTTVRLKKGKSNCIEQWK